jgi:hypothetical protein
MDDQGDVFTFENLGGGQEVGRSCHILQFKGKCVMVACPGCSGRCIDGVAGCGCPSCLSWTWRAAVL